MRLNILLVMEGTVASDGWGQGGHEWEVTEGHILAGVFVFKHVGF